jgi:cyclin-dependent kinase
VKLIDFGLARNSGMPNKNYTSEVVTLWYRPPDILLGNEQYNSKIDIWSIGCIFAEMVNGSPLFKGKNEEQQLDHIYRVVGSPNPEVWEDVTELQFYTKFQLKEREAQPLSKFVPGLSDGALDLLEVSFHPLTMMI